jgi:CheY-like chemotaxis protein
VRHAQDGTGSAQRSPQIVVADDHEPMRELLCVLVTTAGLGTIVGVATDGREAVELVLEHSPQIALLDVEMPRLTGLDAAEVIASYRPATRVVLHTGTDDSRIRDRAAMLGVPLLRKITDVDTLTKVFDGEQPQGAGEPREIAAVVLAALERQAAESVLVLDGAGDVVFYDGGAAEILGLPFPPRPITNGHLRELVAAALPAAPAGAEERPIFRVVRERRTASDVVYSRRGGALVAWATRAVPLLDGDGVFVAAAVYWRELPDP